MARPIWTGSLSFGLVNVPVGLYTATDDKTIHFNQFQAGTTDRIRNKRINERTGEEVENDQIVKGYDLGGGDYVVVTPDELEAAEPGRSKNIEITDFVDLEDIDPVFYKSTYYLAPHREGAEKPYALLRQAMSESKKIGVATFVFRTKQHLVAIRPDAEVLALETLYYADEVRDPVRDIDSLPGEKYRFEGRELDAAKLLVESMAAKWEPESYHDTYREQVMDIIERKARGETISSERPVERQATVVDLLGALEKSVEAAIARRKGGTTEAGAPARAQGSGKRPSRARGSSAKTGAISAAASAVNSRAELLAQASELGIPGRSRMSRGELEEAVASATKKARGRRAS
jgi:DNA end-binding protein Ku